MPFIYDALSICFVRNCRSWVLIVNIVNHGTEVFTLLLQFIFVVILSLVDNKSYKVQLSRYNQLGLIIGIILKDYLDFTPDLQDSIHSFWSLTLKVFLIELEVDKGTKNLIYQIKIGTNFELFLIFFAWLFDFLQI